MDVGLSHANTWYQRDEAAGKQPDN